MKDAYGFSKLPYTAGMGLIAYTHPSRYVLMGFVIVGIIQILFTLSYFVRYVKNRK